MKLYVLMAQRVCDYVGQYGYEALGCMTEYVYHENPDHLHDIRANSLSTGEFESVEIVTIEVDEDDISRRLFPIVSPMVGKCV